AAGLIQLTVGAHLDGYDTAEKVRAVARLSPEEQLPIIRAYYEKMGKSAQGAHPGHIYMLNFLPKHAGKGEDFVLGQKGADGFLGKVYELNRGFDRTGKGTITVGDVYNAAAGMARSAHGKRITIDGTIINPPSPQAASTQAPSTQE